MIEKSISMKCLTSVSGMNQMLFFLKLVELWKNKFYSPYLLRRFMLQKQRSFSLINGRLHGVILRIDTDGNNILLSLILNPNNIYHSLLYYREREISERLNQLFPLDNIIFFGNI